MDEFERRSRLVSLAYEVLRDMEPPADEATTEVMLSALSQAFLDRATALRRSTTPRRERRAGRRWLGATLCLSSESLDEQTAEQVARSLRLPSRTATSP